MIAPVFVDSNVLVYTRDVTEQAKRTCATEWIAHLWSERMGRTSLQVLSEFYVTVTRKLKPGLTQEEAWHEINIFLAWRPQPVDEALLQRAREIERRYRLSWWDSMVVAAAQLQDCVLLLTEDLQDDAVFGAVTVRSPFTLAVEEPRPRYEVASIVQPHRARGRPRKQAVVSR